MGKSCLLCESPHSKTVFQEFEVEIVRCSQCGHVYSLYEQPADYEEYFNAQDLSSVDQFWWNQAHQAMYQDFAEKFIIGREGKLLDFGCGLGFSVQYFSQFPNWEIVGCEISSQAVDFARQELKLTQIVCGRVQDQNWAANSFDLITLWDVIEHLPEPVDILNTLHTLLKPDGLIFIHTPNIQVQLPKARLKKYLKGMKSHIHYLEAKDHIHIYSPATLTRLLTRLGFEQIEFFHLKPIQSVSGSKSSALKTLKNTWFYTAKLLHQLTSGKVNLDNLFVVAKKNHN